MGLFKSAKRAVKKITKPVARVLNKVVPNELKPFLPYAAAVAPYLLPAGTAGAGLLGTMKGRAFLTGGLNLTSQLAQEGAEEGDFSALSLGLAGLQGALTAPGAAETLRGMQVADTYNPELAQLGKPELVGEPLSFLDKARNVGLGTLEKAAVASEGIAGTLQDPFSASLGEFGKAAVVPFSQGSMDLGMATARKALKDYEAELDAFNAQVGADQAASDADRRAAIIASMTRADFTQDIIDETLGQLGLRDGGIARLGFDNGGDVEYDNKDTVEKYAKRLADDEDISYEEALKIAKEEFPEPTSFSDKLKRGLDVFKGGTSYNADGGIARLGFDNGGDVSFGGIKEAIKGVAQNNMEEGVTQMYVSDSAGVIPLRDGDAVTGKTMDMMVSGFVEPYTKNDFRDPDGYERFMDIFSEFKETKMKKDKELNEEGMEKGGLASLKDGGIMNLGGKEMDMRTGGFIPIGAKERADDVPARLSKNEFVMTADAVRAAGGGSVNKGAKRMYDLMHNLEARA
jgi:hypothetical protein